MDTKTLQKLKDNIEGEIYTDDLHKMIYATDASVYRELPMAVIIPKSESDLQIIIKHCYDHEIPIIPRAGGTSLAGQCVGNGIVIDISKHFDKILEINKEERWVRVQPGVIRDQLNNVLRHHGLFFGPNTSTANRAMIGGMVGNNSCGTTSIVYGTTRDKTIALQTILSDGSKADFKNLSLDKVAIKCKSTSLEGQIYKHIIEIIKNDQLREEVDNKFPRPSIDRRNTGYALDSLMDKYHKGELNLCDLLAGSEGTLAFTTEIKLRVDLLPPPHEVLLAAHFNDINSALKAVVVAMKHRPYACELMDKTILDCTRGHLTYDKDRAFVMGDPAGVLMISYREETIVKAEEKLKMISQEMEKSSLGYHYPIISENVDRIWNLRKAGLGLLANIPGDKNAVACIEDTAVSIDDLPEYIAEFEELMEGFGQKAVYYAHAGAGELHLRPILNLKAREDRRLFHDISLASAKLVKKYRGSLSGEHGDGRVRAPFLSLMVGDILYKVFCEIKNVWDPKGIFNPGKIVDAKAITDDLRYEEDARNIEKETIYDFNVSSGLLGAAEQCNGSGDCRKLPEAGGTMCPSYQATKDEKDTTRARANTLREVITNSQLANPFEDEHLAEVLELCLSCKGCTSECPSNVNMTMLKSEVLYQKYKEKGFPLRSKVFAYVDKVNSYVSKFSGLSNLITENRWTSSIVKKLTGVHHDRSIPQLSKVTLRSYLKDHKSSTIKDRKVCMFIDEFSNHYDVEVGIKAVELLENLGYEVMTIEHNESGRAAFSKGMLDYARCQAVANIEIFSQVISDEIPLIGIEPSAILSFRDEYPLIVGAQLKSKALELANHTYTIEEFLYNESKKGNISRDQFSLDPKTIHLHGHCHQKALTDINEVAWLLSIPENFDVAIIPSGCCGMAGSFGYEKEHYDISMKIGETTLFPYLRKLKNEEIIVASGTSCRHQIADGVGRKSYHTVEVLYNALNKKK